MVIGALLFLSVPLLLTLTHSLSPLSSSHFLPGPDFAQLAPSFSLFPPPLHTAIGVIPKKTHNWGVFFVW